MDPSNSLTMIPARNGSVKIRPQYTINHPLLEIFPLDKWSRKKIILSLNKVGYAYTPTTMGECSLRFHNQEDFNLALSIVSKIEMDENEKY